MTNFPPNFEIGAEVRSHFWRQARDEVWKLRKQAADAVNKCMAQNGSWVRLAECEVLPDKYVPVLERQAYERRMSEFMDRVVGDSTTEVNVRVSPDFIVDTVLDAVKRGAFDRELSAFAVKRRSR